MTNAATMLFLATLFVASSGFLLHRPSMQLGKDSFPRALPSRVSVPVLELDSKLPAPPEVIEAEAKATPNRKFRLAGAGVGIGVSAISGVTAVASLAGSGNSDVLLFGNPILTLLADTLVGGSCAWALQQELKTRDENIARIWEEVQRRRRGGAKSGANRSQRRAKKPPAGARVAGSSAGFTGGGAMPSSPPKSSSPPPATPPGAGGGDEPSGLLAGVQQFFDEANEMGKAQAQVLNSKLEAAGVLEPLGASAPVSAPLPPSQVEGDANLIERETMDDSPSLPTEDVDDALAADEPSARAEAKPKGKRTARSGGAGGKQKAKGKKRKRRK